MAKQAASTLGDLDLNSSPTHLLHRLGQCATDLFQEELHGVDLTPRQFAVLNSIAQKEGASQTDLVEMTGIDRSTLADIVRRMLKKGLVQRRRTKDDARAYAVKLTEQGRKTLKAADPLVRGVDTRILGALSATEQNKFMSNLHAMIDKLSGGEATTGRGKKVGSKASKGRAGSRAGSKARKS